MRVDLLDLLAPTPATLHQIPSGLQTKSILVHDIQRYQANREDARRRHWALKSESMNYRIFTGPFVSFHAYSCNKKVSILSKYIINKDLIVAKNGEAIAPSSLGKYQVDSRGLRFFLIGAFPI